MFAVCSVSMSFAEKCNKILREREKFPIGYNSVYAVWYNTIPHII